MKNQKRIFNEVLIRYNRYRNKLSRLIKEGKNVRKQDILQRRIKKMHVSLLSMQQTIRLATASAAIIGASMIFQPQTVNAQPFNGVTMNPFSLTSVGFRSTTTFADLDNDGDLDMLSGEYSGNFYYFENIAGPGVPPVFGPPTLNPFSLTSIGIYRTTPTFVDLDHDGLIDIVTGDYYGNFYFIKNTGTVSAPEFSSTPVLNPFSLSNTGVYYSSPTFADLDNDGDLDMMAGNQSGDFIYYENTAGPSAVPVFALPVTNPFSLINPGIIQSTPTFVDLDGDGDLDMMSGVLLYGSFYYFKNTGTANAPDFSTPPELNPYSLSNTGDNRSSPTFVDMDGDGDLDMMSGGNTGNFFYYENIGPPVNLTFDPVVADPFSLTNSGEVSNSSPTFADLDNDGDLDMMSGSYAGDFYYYQNTGSAHAPDFSTPYVINPFSLSPVISPGTWGSYGYSAPAFADLDNDGDLDMISGAYYGEFYYFENTGTVSAPDFSTGPVLNPFNLVSIEIGTLGKSAPAFADLDGDGDLDMISGHLYGDFYYFENTGTLSAPDFSTQPVKNPFALSKAGYNSTPAFADLDKDGDLDMLSGNQDGNFVFFQNIGTAISPRFSTAPATNPFSLTDIGYDSKPAFADLDNDGDLDLMSGGGYLAGSFYYFQNTQLSNLTWTGSTDTDWNTASNWDPATVPTTSNSVIIPDVTNDPVIDQAVSTPATCVNLTIDTDGKLTINAAKALTVEGKLTNHSGTTQLVLGSGASLKHLTPGVDGTVKRTIAKDGKYHFLSSPICSFVPICDGNFAPTLATFSADAPTYGFFKWSEPFRPGNLNWLNLKNTDLTLNTADFGTNPVFDHGKGYLVLYKSDFGGNADKSFMGTLGAGNINIPVTVSHNTYNLVGNPYPSFIDWKAATGWDRSALAASGGGYNFWIWNGAAGNYGVYNSFTDLGNNGVTRYIAPGQGFFVKAVSGGNVALSDAVRCHSTQAWLKSGSNVLSVKVNSALNGYSDEIMMKFCHPVTGGAEKWFSMYDEAPSLYLPVGDDIYSLRFLGEVSENPTIPLSFKAGVDGNYSFTVIGTEEFANCTLQDLKTGIIQDIKTNPVYNFTSSISDDVNRFLLRFSAVSIENQTVENSGIYVYDNTLYISNPGVSIVEVYSMLGQKLVAEKTHNEPLYQFKIEAVTGYYVVRLTTGQKVYTKKIFVK